MSTNSESAVALTESSQFCSPPSSATLATSEAKVEFYSPASATLATSEAKLDQYFLQLSQTPTFLINHFQILLNEANRLHSIHPLFWEVVSRYDTSHFLITKDESLLPVFLPYFLYMIQYFQNLKNLPTPPCVQSEQSTQVNASVSFPKTDNPTGSNNNLVTCWHYLNNRCHFGNRCRKYHPPPQSQQIKQNSDHSFISPEPGNGHSTPTSRSWASIVEANCSSSSSVNPSSSSTSAVSSSPDSSAINPSSPL